MAKYKDMVALQNDWQVMPFCGLLPVQYVQPTNIRSIQAHYQFNGWMANCPLNQYRTFGNLVNTSHCLYISKDAAERFVPTICKTYQKNYGLLVQAHVLCEDENSVIIKFITIQQ